jgi:3-oxoacyl-[acyl-carrier protein] reductase
MRRNNVELTRKVCLITGGTSGIGAATALEVARRGADVAITGLPADLANCAVKAQVEALGRRCHLAATDLTQPVMSAAWVREAAAVLGGVDVLVHCAGGPVPGSLLEVSEAAWYKAFDLHVHAVFHLCRAAAPLMKQRGEGAIVLISSAAGARGCLGAIAHGVAKGAIPQFTRTLARELADSKITVNCVSPGIIRTRFQSYLTPEQVRNNIENRIPLHREGTAEDVAQAIVALVTNGYITGENLAVDGGMTMRIV